MTGIICRKCSGLGPICVMSFMDRWRGSCFYRCEVCGAMRKMTRFGDVKEASLLDRLYFFLKGKLE